MQKVYKASRKSATVLRSPSKMSIEVVLTDRSVIYKSGILAKRVEEIPYSKINSVNVKQGLVERSLGFGDVIIMTGNDVNGIVLQNIDNPQGLKNDIMSMAQGSATTASLSSPDDPTAQLERLAALKAKGLITPADFEAKKKQLLGL